VSGPADPLIVGGGLAGAAAACLLARSGCRPLLLEREAGPRHKVCGEFLSIEAQDALREIGIEPRDLGASLIRTVRLVDGDRVAEAELPFEALGLTRRVLDEALLSRGAALGARVERGRTVRSLTAQDGGVAVELAGGGRRAAAAAFLATGKHALRSVERRGVPGLDDGIGLKAYLTLAPEQARSVEGAIEVILFEGGYAGLQTVEGGEANLCLLVRQDLFRRVGSCWEGLLRHLTGTVPHLAKRLSGAGDRLRKPVAIAGLPYGFVHRPAADEAPHLYRLGDQAAVIPSFAGDGMAIALHSAKLAVGAYLAGEAAPAYHIRLGADVAPQIGLAVTLQRMAQGPLGRRLLVGAASAWPGLLPLSARLTRVPERALRRAALAHAA
jgi:menaquinone-9 beta-reductase